MSVVSCIPVVPSKDLEKSLKLWRDGLGFTDFWWEQRDPQTNKLIGCGFRKGHMSFMLNRRDGTLIKPDDYNGIHFYWAPPDLEGLHTLRGRLIALGFAPTELVLRDYGHTEFFLTDDDGFDHCFGLRTVPVQPANQ